MTTSQTSWRPLLDGELAERARESVLEIAEALRLPATDPEAMQTAGYAGGQAGLALFYTYLGMAYPDRDFRDVAERYLDKAVDAVAEQPMQASFYGGFTGVAWVYEHLQGRLFEPADEDLNESIDEALGQLLATSPWQFDYDLIGGLVGFGVYILERKARPAAPALAEALAARLAETAREQDGGLTWWTSPTLMIPETAERYPEGYYNLGLAHGVPGVVGLLGELVAAGLGGPDARRLLDGAVAWLRARRRATEDGSVFSYYHVPGPGQESGSCRSAWCYGDPGAAIAWLLAGRAVGAADWEREAMAIAVRDTRRLPAHAGVVDAGICHGATGLAHVYNRIYQATGEPALGDAARAWYERALAMRKTGEGNAGYLTYGPAPGSMTDMQWKPEAGLLSGAAGVGLALLAATHDALPDWDRPLLVSIAPRA